jgi:CRP/FNR family transcriptional regulator
MRFKIYTSFPNSQRPSSSASTNPPVHARNPIFGPLVMTPYRLPGAEQRIFPAGKTLFSQGERSLTTFVIESGVVRLTAANDDKHGGLVGLRSKGCILEPSSTLLNEPCACSAETLTRTVVSTVPSSEFRRLILCDPIILREFNDHLAREISALEEQEALLRSGSVEDRLRQLLGELQEAECAERLREIGLKHREVAQILSITPEHLSRLLHRFLQNPE